MESNFKLYRLPEGFIITSEDEPKINDTVLIINSVEQRFIDIVSKETTTGVWVQDDTYHYPYKIGNFIICKKIIALQNQIDFSNLSNVDKKKINLIDIEKLSLLYARTIPAQMSEDELDYAAKGFYNGFVKAQDTYYNNMFTEEELRKAMDMVKQETYTSIGAFPTYDLNNIINIIKTSRHWDIEIEMEQNQCDGCLANYPIINGIHQTPYPSGNMFCQKQKYMLPKLKDNKIKILKIL